MTSQLQIPTQALLEDADTGSRQEIVAGSQAEAGHCAVKGIKAPSSGLILVGEVLSYKTHQDRAASDWKKNGAFTFPARADRGPQMHGVPSRSLGAHVCLRLTARPYLEIVPLEMTLVPRRSPWMRAGPKSHTGVLLREETQTGRRLLQLTDKPGARWKRVHEQSAPRRAAAGILTDPSARRVPGSTDHHSRRVAPATRPSVEERTRRGLPGQGRTIQPREERGADTATTQT